MTIAEELAALEPPKLSKFDRWYTTWFETLDKDDRKAITEAATNESISTRKLVIFFQGKGAVVAKEAVEAWRKANGLNR